MRCLALAEHWVARGGRAELVGSIQSPVVRALMTDRGIDLTDVPMVHPEPDDLSRLLDICGRRPSSSIAKSIGP